MSAAGALPEAGPVPQSFQLPAVLRDPNLQPSHRLQRAAAPPGAPAGQQQHPLPSQRRRHLPRSAGASLSQSDGVWCKPGCCPKTVPPLVQALSERFSGEMPDELSSTTSFFPEEYFTCCSVCLSCGYDQRRTRKTLSNFHQKGLKTYMFVKRQTLHLKASFHGQCRNVVWVNINSPTAVPQFGRGMLSSSALVLFFLLEVSGGFCVCPASVRKLTC